MDCVKKRKRFNYFLVLVFCIFVIICIFSLRPSAQNTNRICETPQCLISAGILRKSVNPTVNPCDNFYQYACGKWGKTHPSITEYVPSSTVEERNYWNRIELQEFLRQKNNESEPAAVHKARKLFSLCLNTDAIDRKGIGPIQNIFNRTGVSVNPTKNFDLIAATVKMTKLLGIDMFYSIGVTPDPYNQTLNRIGISKPVSGELARIPTLQRKRFRQYDDPIRPASPTLSKSEYMQLVFKALCENDTSDECQLYLSPQSNSVKLTKLREYESDFSTVTTKSYPKSSPGAIPNIYSLKYLQNLTDTIPSQKGMPSLNWTETLQLLFENVENVSLDFSKPEEVQVVFEELYIKDILSFIHSRSLEEHELGMLWTIADTLAEYTYYSLRNSKANYTSDLKDAISRSSWCTDSVSQLLGMAVSYYYATNETYNNTKKEVTEMVNNIRTIFREGVKSSPWIDEVTKEKALKKVDSMKKLISFPYSLANTEDLNQYYRDLVITDDFLESVLTKVQQEISEELKTLNTINSLEEDRRIVTPIEVNAFYDPERNTMIIPAGILGFPVYGHGLKALDYGSIGTTIGHEITHGFDSQGRRYNYLGNLEEWWRNETLIDFVNRASCFKNAYQSYSYSDLEDNVTTDGLLTLTENIADNGGFKHALLAYKQYVLKNGEEPKLFGFDSLTHEQLFTLGFANLWCEHSTTLSSLLASASDHSPNPIRVNGVAINSEDFSRIWNCPKGTNMNPDVKKCQLW